MDFPPISITFEGAFYASSRYALAIPRNELGLQFRGVQAPRQSRHLQIRSV